VDGLALAVVGGVDVIDATIGESIVGGGVYRCLGGGGLVLLPLEAVIPSDEPTSFTSESNTFIAAFLIRVLPCERPNDPPLGTASSQAAILRGEGDAALGVVGDGRGEGPADVDLIGKPGSVIAIVLERVFREARGGDGETGAASLGSRCGAVPIPNLASSFSSGKGMFGSLFGVGVSDRFSSVNFSSGTNIGLCVVNLDGLSIGAAILTSLSVIKFPDKLRSIPDATAGLDLDL